MVSLCKGKEIIPFMQKKLLKKNNLHKTMSKELRSWGGFSLKHLLDALDASNEDIDVFAGVVEGEAGTAGAFDAQAAHQRLGTMMACADGNAQAVEQCAHIEVVDRPSSQPFPL